MYRHVLFLINLLVALVVLGVSGCGQSTTPKKSAANEELMIIDVLKREDLPQSVRENLKFSLSPTVSKRSLDRMIMVAADSSKNAKSAAARKTPPQPKKNSLRISTKFAMSAGSMEGPLPTLSRSNRKSPINYAKKPTKYRDQFDALKSVGMRGIKNFQQEEIYKLTSADRTAAVKLMESILTETIRPHDEKRWKSLATEATKLESKALGLRLDPIFLKYCGIALGESGDAIGAAERLRNSLDEFEKSNYPSWEVVNTVRWLFEYQQNRVGKQTKVKQMVHYGIAVKHWLSEDFQMEPHQHSTALRTYRDFVALMTVNDDWKMMNDVHETVAANTDLPPWLRAMIRADYERKVGLFYRGGGMPDTVSKEHWGYFETRVKQAAEFYKEAFEINPWSSESSEGLLALANYGYLENVDGKEPGDYWFEQTMRAAPHNYSACCEMLFNLLPQWGGSIEEMIAFTKEQAFKGQNDSMLPYLQVYCYFTIRNQAAGSVEERIKATESPEFVRDMLRGLDLIIKNMDEDGREVDGKMRDKYYFISMKAIFAKQFGVVDVADETFRLLGDKLNKDAVRITGYRTSSVEAFRARDHAMTGEFTPEADKVNKLMKGGLKARLENFKQIINTCDSVLREVSDPVTKVYFSKIRRKVKAEFDFDTGEQVELGFTKKLELWGSNASEQITYESPSTLKVDNTGEFVGFRFSANVECPGAKVVEFDLEYPTSNVRGLFQAHDLVPSYVPYIIKKGEIVDFVTMGMSLNPKPTKLMGSELSAQIGAFYIGRFLVRNKPVPVFLEMASQKVHFKYIVQPKLCEVYINDNFVRRIGFPDDMELEIKNTFEISHPEVRKGRGIFKLSNVRIKKWKEKAPSFAGPPDEIVAYYKDLLEDNPKDRWLAFWYARALHRAGNKDEAIDAYKQAVKLGIEKSDVAFYLADAYERNGDYKTAVNVYNVGCAISPTNAGMHIDRNPYMQSHENWSSYRYAWRMLTSPDSKTRAEFDPKKYATPFPPGINSWAIELLKAQQLAVNGKFEEAKALTQKVVVRCNSKQEKLVLPIIQAYDQGKAYTQDWSEKPIYQDLDQNINLFK